MIAIDAKEAPEAIGTYSHAIKTGHTVYISGQIPLLPETMQMCSDNIAEQIEQVIKNLGAVCRASGGHLKNIVKLNVYLTDLNHFTLVNEAMKNSFTEPYPARAAIGVSALPKGAQVEMDAVMVIEA